MRVGWGTCGILVSGIIISLLNLLYSSYQQNDTRIGVVVSPYLGVILGKTPWLAIWTILTAPLVQTKLIPSIIIFLVVVSGGNYCEKYWSTPNYLAFVVVSMIAPIFIEMFLGALLIVAVRSRTYSLAFYGANGLLAGIIVALRQLIPGHRIILMKNRVRIEVKWLPTIFLAIFFLIELMGGEENSGAFYIGFVTSWYYLRYHQKGDRGEIGDASDAFAFANLFPRLIADIIEPLVDGIHYTLSAKLKLVRKFNKEEIQGANERYSARLSGLTLPSYNSRNARSTNERRKMMLKAMERET